MSPLTKIIENLYLGNYQYYNLDWIDNSTQILDHLNEVIIYIDG